MASVTTPARLVPRTRPLPARKQVLFASHRHLLLNNDLVLFLRPTDFSATEWRQLRAAIGQVHVPGEATSSSSSSSSSSSTLAAQSLTLTVLRPGLLPALLRDESLSSRINTGFLSQPSHLQGPLAVLTCPSLHPPTLSRVLTILSKFSRQPSRNAPPPAPADAKSKSSAAPAVVERMAVMSSLLEHTRIADEQRTRNVIAKLPPLNVLQSQVVGLLSTPASRIAGILGARSREVGRTVQGFKEGLEQAQGQGQGQGQGQVEPPSASP